MTEIDPHLLSDFEKSLPHHYMILVEGGVFDMGDRELDSDIYDKPVHLVNVPSFYISKFPVTQGLWESVMGKNPSDFKGKDRPVENVSWEDAQEFVKMLFGFTGKKYRLPTESEWEFAARGGIHPDHSDGFLFAGSDKLKEVGWYEVNSGNETHPVGQKLSNELELHDMSGNVWEWVEDQWHSNYENAPLDGSAWVDRDKSTNRVYRGGSWYDEARDCRVSYRESRSREFRSNFIGFRLALSLQSRG